MSLVEEIRCHLAFGANQCQPIMGLPQEYPAWTYRCPDWFGVLVPMKEYFAFTEEFTNAKVYTMEDIAVDGVHFPCIVLSCSDNDLRNSFASICCQFVLPGENGSQRELLVSNPEKWWQEWKKLLGNANSNKNPYPVLAELLVFEKVMRSGYHPFWEGLSSSARDIETDEGRAFEVKSTVDRYGYEVTINSQYQMDTSINPVTLVFCRFEPTEAASGISVNDQVKKLVDLGCPPSVIETQLRRKNLVPGRIARKQKYNLLEMRFFPVNDKFPAITSDMLPAGVKGITYRIDLTGLESSQEP